MEKMNKTIVFFYPFPLPTESSSGSQLRLLRMLQAFRSIGYHVEVVTGFARDRRRLIRHVKESVKRGRRFDFLYAESSTLPSLLAKRNFLHPLLDLNFFRWLQRHNISIGLFYRDVHWRFPQRKSMNLLRRWIAIPMYWYDWGLYRRFVDHLFLPSLSMRFALPGSWPIEHISALPPGSDITSLQPKKTADNSLHLFYVGGIKPPLYDLQTMFHVVKSLNRVHLTVCCREFEWEEIREYYKPFSGEKIRVAHASGEDLETYYAQADVFGLFWKPNAYLDFAMPVKLFETLGHAVPIVTTAGTEVSRFVARENIGWVVKTKAELRSLLVRLRDNRDAIAVKRARMLEIRERHTWRARAQNVAEILSGYNKG